MSLTIFIIFILIASKSVFIVTIPWMITSFPYPTVLSFFFTSIVGMSLVLNPIPPHGFRRYRSRLSTVFLLLFYCFIYVFIVKVLMVFWHIIIVLFNRYFFIIVSLCDNVITSLSLSFYHRSIVIVGKGPALHFMIA